ncbi:MAG: sugar ABC transporter substrate-binding protein [Treponema sp.]|jgi:lactose/L-arabinose transport system substrate-binding protein|nr:sugar ABC transporter substrate-binding protein [Treponema sp.]
MKKVAVLIIFGIFVTLNYGCSKKNTGQLQEKAAIPKGKITVWVFSDEVNVNGLKAAIPAFKTLYPNIEPEIVAVAGSDVHTKLMTTIASGSGIPDAAHIGVWDTMNFVSKGALWDITDRVKPYVNDILPYQVAAYQDKERLYGIPWGGTAAAVYYRRDIFKSAGVDPDQIHTWTDFIMAGKKISSSSNGKVKMINLPVGTSGEKASLQHFQQLLTQQLGSSIYNAKGEITINDAANVKALNLIIEMINNGIGSNIEPWSPAEFGSWNNGSVATVVNASWMKGIIEGQAGNSGNWGIMKLPAFEDGSTRVSSAGGSGMVIPAAAKNKEAAWVFIEYFLTRPAPQTEAYKLGCPIPSLLTTYSDETFKKPENYWGGQVAGNFFTQIEPQVPPVYYGKDYREIMTSILPEGIWKAVTGKTGAQTALDEVKAAIESKL